MAIGTYSQLKTAVENWRERVGDTTISGNAADFITLGEAELTRQLPLRIMWTNADLTGTNNSRELDLDATFAEPAWLKLTTTSPYTPLPKSTSDGMFYYQTASATPTEWCLNGDHIDLNYPCSGALTFQFRYRQKFALSDASPTNWLLTNHPDIYLGAVLVWSGLLIKDEDVSFWKPKTEEAIRQLKILDAKSDADVSLLVDPALVRNNRGTVAWPYSAWLNG